MMSDWKELNWQEADKKETDEKAQDWDNVYLRKVACKKRRRVSCRRRRILKRRLRMAVILLFLVCTVGIICQIYGNTGQKKRFHSSRDDLKQEQYEEIWNESLSSYAEDLLDEWNLILVNPWNKIPEGYEVELTELRGGHAVDSRCYEQLQRMMDDCRAEGLHPVICASYRTAEKQQALFQDKIRRVLQEGCPESLAEQEAAKTVARPGTSEHQLGLALDIVDRDYQQLDTRQEETPVQQWLMRNSWRYGFILRYPTDKSEITGIIYEPWHYRYVGAEAAAIIYEEGICLEEYLELYRAIYDR